MATGAERYKSKLSKSTSTVTVNGKWYPGNEERHAQIKDFKIRPDDIFVVCFPKSGTHWLYRILSFLLTDGDLDNAQHYPFVPMEVTPPYLPKTPLQLLEEAPSPRVMASHLPFEMCPKQIQEGKCKIILVVRNPKDVAVSHFYFHKKLKTIGDFSDLTFSDFLDAYCTDDAMPYGTWFSNVKNWLEHRNDPNLLIVKYEDLKKDLVNGVIRLAEFLGRPVDGDRASAIAERSHFEGMMQSASKEKDSSKTSQPLTTFMRKGIIGDWKTHFTVAQNDMFDEVYKKEMEGHDLTLDFE